MLTKTPGTPTTRNLESQSAEVLLDDISKRVDLLLDHERLSESDFDSANAPRQRNHTITKVSILVPVFNERWTVEKLLNRVLDVQLGLEMEVIVVDDKSTDGSAEIVQKLAEKEDRVRLFRHEKNQGKGAALRTAIQHITGDVVIIQDADLEYDPSEYPRLLRPILQCHADAVYGSRFAGEERRVLLFWHSLGNKLLTLMCNALNDLNLTDMETCYKVFRTDVLKQLRLQANSFTIEPEITARLAQWGARLYEVPISYRGRKRHEGKKICATDGVKAICAMLKLRFWDTRFTWHTGMYVLRSVEKAQRYNRWMVDRIGKYLGNRVAEAGAGLGNMSHMLADCEHLLLVDHDPIYVAYLEDAFHSKGNVRVLQSDLNSPGFEQAWQKDELDTVFCSNVLEHLGPHEQIMESFHRALRPDGHCIIIVPAEPKLYNGLDTSLGHHRRYEESELRRVMEQAGFDIVHSEQVCKLGALAWFVNGKILRRRRLTPRQMLLFDRLWPYMQRLDRFLPWRGMSLIMVGKKSAD